MEIKTARKAHKKPPETSSGGFFSLIGVDGPLRSRNRDLCN